MIEVHIINHMIEVLNSRIQQDPSERSMYIRPSTPKLSDGAPVMNNDTMVRFRV